jgi:prolyl oligopeptidase
MSRFFRRTLAAVVVVLWASVALAQAPQVVPPDLDSFVQRVMQAFQVPGVSLAIVKDGQVVVARGYGTRKLGEPATVDARTLFGIASNTKVFTATALGLLVEQGKLQWDAPVVNYLPWFQMYDPYVTRELTIRDLLVHRSGLGLGAGDLLWWPASTYDRKEIARRLRYIKPATSFRSAYAYDNVLYLVAGEVIETVSGQSWEDFVSTRILAKAGMTASNVRHSAAAGGGNVAAPHAPIDGKVRPIQPFDSDNTNPAGGINACADDMAKWLKVLLNEGQLPDGSRLFSAATWRQISAPVTPQPNGAPPPELPVLRSNFRGYALGLEVRDFRGYRVLTHTGGLPGYVSRVLLIPDLKLGVAVLTNQESGEAFNAIAFGVADAYVGEPRSQWLEGYQKIAARTEAALAQADRKTAAARNAASKPSLPLASYARVYRDAWYGDIAITEEGGRLVMRFTKTPSLVGHLEHWQYDTFVVRWRDRELRADAFVTFALNPDGSIDQAKMQAVSPSTDFSFDFQDLLLKPIAAMPTSRSQPDTPTLAYPVAKKVDQVDDFFGTRVADPYRWLEDSDAPDTRAWIDAENRVTFDYLSQVPERARIKARLTEIWNYERFGAPSREGGWYVFARNSGLQPQAVIYRARSLADAPEVLIDPNTLSKDGTVALGSTAFTDDGRYMAYSVAAGGSDWIEWRVRDVATSKDLPDLIKWSKFSGASWLKDGSGFYYSRYDEPTGEVLQALNKHQKVFFHRLGTPQEKDVLVYERPDKPDWGFGAEVTEDGRFLLVVQSEGTDNRNRVFVRDLKQPGGAIEPFLDAFDAAYTVVGNDGDTFYVLTNKNAPRFRLVAIQRTKPAEDAWRTLIPEAKGTAVLQGVTMVNDQFVALWMTDAHHGVRVYGLDGTPGANVALPTLGSVGALTGRRAHKEMFYSFGSFLYPTSIYRYDFASRKSTIFKKPALAFDASAYETMQVFYTSKDGTRVPMFLTYKKGLAKNGRNPTLLYGYGGFNIATLPAFSAGAAGWLEMGGVYAVANLRGGGEYGQAWYDAGRLQHKQNVFDDFIAAAEYLIREGYTSTPKLAIHGGSNGGLLVGACLTQRPDLFGAAVPAVGVMDMLRFDKFTIGWAWRSDYGEPSARREDFESVMKYSPLHTIKPGVAYPATFVTTADHDDRVVPLHSFKFTATLQAAQAGPAPVLIRIDTKAGHGAGKPTDKVIEERADMYGFLVRELKMTLPAGYGK